MASRTTPLRNSVPPDGSAKYPSHSMLCDGYLSDPSGGTEFLNGVVLKAMESPDSTSGWAILNDGGFFQTPEGARAVSRLQQQDKTFCAGILKAADLDKTNLSRSARLRRIKGVEVGVGSGLCMASPRFLQLLDGETSISAVKTAENGVTDLMARVFDYDALGGHPSTASETYMQRCEELKVECDTVGVAFPDKPFRLIERYLLRGKPTTAAGMDKQAKATLVVNQIKYSIGPEATAAVAEILRCLQFIPSEAVEGEWGSNLPSTLAAHVTTPQETAALLKASNAEAKVLKLQQQLKESDGKKESGKPRLHANVAATGSVRSCYGCKLPGHNLRDCPTTPKVAGTDGITMDSMMCHICGANGHKKVHCPTSTTGSPKNGAASSPSVTTAGATVVS